MSYCSHGEGDSDPCMSTDDDIEDEYENEARRARRNIVISSDDESADDQQSDDEVSDNDEHDNPLLTLVNNHIQDEQDELQRSMQEKRVYKKSTTMRQHARKIQQRLEQGCKKIEVNTLTNI